MSKKEGDAYSYYISQGKRMPRRGLYITIGEIGLDSETIENYEKQGYQMSGTMHKAIT